MREPYPPTENRQMDKRINTMAIQFEPTTNTFYLDGKGVTYAFCINEYGYAEHLYYGKRIGHDDLRAMRMLGATSYRTTPPGRDLNSSSKYGGINSYHHFPAELAFFGTGDFREPAVELTHADGNRLTELLYVDHEILPCKPKINGCPRCGAGKPWCSTSRMRMTALPAISITPCMRTAASSRAEPYTKNQGSTTVMLDRAYSFSFSLPRNDYDILTLYGSWAKERHVDRTPMHHGVFAIDSKRTTSSATLNPFMAILDKDTTEQQGNAYGVSLVYSSSYALKAESTSDGRTLVTGGINDFDFRWKLEAGENFETPEVMLAYSFDGIGGMSRELHDAIRTYLVNPDRVYQPRPIVINNWEATYFHFDREKLKAIAQAVEGTGIDTFVLDDGWFGKRRLGQVGTWRLVCQYREAGGWPE